MDKLKRFTSKLLEKAIPCKHEKVLPHYSFLEKQEDGTKKRVVIWKCLKCGMEMRS